MDQFLAASFNILALLFILASSRLKGRGIGIAAVSVIILQAILSFILAVDIFRFGSFTWILPGSAITGPIPLRGDVLSAWFILIIGLGFVLGSIYGLHYLRSKAEDSGRLRLHAVSLVLVFTALVDITLVQHALAFLLVWEIMALGSFMIVIFDWEKKDVLRAGLNFLIQSHVAILFLTLGFIWIRVNTGSYDFESIATYTGSHPAMGIGLFIVFFVGFAIKAGFVPFHTWLPLAHPAAPAHVSGMMSGVIIKIGIFGILRMLTLVESNFRLIGYFILIISAITGVYGVMLAIVQHNLKKLLAYHSIENIGIIGLGIGLGCLGIGMGNPYLVAAGFAGSLLHTLNHSLFKSLLFYSAGNVYLAGHTMDVERLGGFLKKLPKTGFFFLLGALAICGLPPFNGFVSEFLIYNGLFHGLGNGQLMFTMALLFAVVSLVLIGGLAILCFTKAFGVVFLGSNRSGMDLSKAHEPAESTFSMVVLASGIVLIGLLPFLLAWPMDQIANLYSDGLPNAFIPGTLQMVSQVGIYSTLFILFIVLLFLIRKRATRRASRISFETWGCGYTALMPKAQYTASSFVRTYRKLFEPLLRIKKEKVQSDGLYPAGIGQETHPSDKLEYLLIDKPLLFIKRIIDRFTFLQNGNIQAYILYGFLFILSFFMLPVVYRKIMDFISFINRL